jgi:hypothetical protein
MEPPTAIAQIFHELKHIYGPETSLGSRDNFQDCHDQCIIALRSMHEELVLKTKKLRSQVEQTRRMVNTHYFALQSVLYEKNIFVRERIALSQYPIRYTELLKSIQEASLSCNSTDVDIDTSNSMLHYSAAKAILMKELQNRVQLMEKVQLLEKQKSLLLTQQSRYHQHVSEFKQAYKQFYNNGSRLITLMKLLDPSCTFTMSLNNSMSCSIDLPEQQEQDREDGEADNPESYSYE